MSCVIRFTTRLFDVTQEHPNPINPIPGESLLWWLQGALAPTHTLTPPQPEDWGWYSHVDWDGRRYLIGASCDDEDGPAREWLLRIVKRRGPVERLLGRARFDAADPCMAEIRRVLEAEPAFSGVAVD